jgi:leucyl aminopeptidase (aminopeptidase T)
MRFRVGDRPFNKQDGDASARRMESARIRIDREIELPAGVLRVAPLEETVQGVLVVPEARMRGEIAKNIRLVLDDGKITSFTADQHLAAVAAELASGGESARSFREFCLGFHPGLLWNPGDKIIPYFGYGAGVVRMSLGDNEELGGAVRGGYSRWLFFPDATVEVGDKVLVRDGRLS